MDPVYGYQYQPYQISPNAVVNHAYGFANQTLGLEGPNLVSGMRPSDVAFAAGPGGKNLEYGMQQIYNTVDPIFDAMKNAGGGSLVDKARAAYGNQAAAYLSNNSMVQQAMGGNVDLFGRQMIANATGLVNPQFTIPSLGHQAVFQSQAIEASSMFTSSLLKDIYKGGVTPDRGITRGFKVEELGGVIAGLAKSGKFDLSGVAHGIATGDNDLVQNTINANKFTLARRLETLSVARDVFGSKSAKDLTRDIEGLMGAGADSDTATADTLRRVSALATTLNKDVKAMVESRKVIAGALKEMNMQSDPTGQNIGVGGSSRFGDTEALAIRIGDSVDVMTHGIANERHKAQTDNDITTMMSQAEQSSAGRLSTLMRLAEQSEMAEPGLMQAYAEATRTGDHGAALKIAKQIGLSSGIGDPEAIINNSRLFANTTSLLKGDIIDKHGTEKGTKMLDQAMSDHRYDMQDGMVGETDIKNDRAKFNTISSEIKRLERSSGLRLKKDTPEQAAARFKKNAIHATEEEFRKRLAGATDRESYNEIERQMTNAMESIKGMGGTVGEMKKDLMDGSIVGISEEMGNKVARGAVMATKKEDQAAMRKLAAGSEVNDLKMKKLKALLGNSDEAREMISNIKDAKTPEEKARLIADMESKAFQGKSSELKEQYDREIKKAQETIVGGQKRDEASLQEAGEVGGIVQKNAVDTMKKNGQRGRSEEFTDGVKKVAEDQQKGREIVEKNPEVMEKIASALQEALIKGVKEGMEKADIKIDKKLKIDDTEALKVQIINLSSLPQTPK